MAPLFFVLVRLPRNRATQAHHPFTGFALAQTVEEALALESGAERLGLEATIAERASLTNAAIIRHTVEANARAARLKATKP